jgi:hypothetical protein
MYHRERQRHANLKKKTGCISLGLMNNFIINICWDIKTTHLTTGRNTQTKVIFKLLALIECTGSLFTATTRHKQR